MCRDRTVTEVLRHNSGSFASFELFPLGLFGPVRRQLSQQQCFPRFEAIPVGAVLRLREYRDFRATDNSCTFCAAAVDAAAVD